MRAAIPEGRGLVSRLDRPSYINRGCQEFIEVASLLVGHSCTVNGLTCSLPSSTHILDSTGTIIDRESTVLGRRQGSPYVFMQEEKITSGTKPPARRLEPFHL